jgi:hypothetical protein
MRQGLSIRVDSAEFRRTMLSLRGFDKRIYALTRKRIREAAKPVVADVRAELRSGGPSETGMRDGLAAGTRASVSIGKKAGVTIVTSPARLPRGKQQMARSWNNNSFRHPVFGDRQQWVSQTGNPYFESTILAHKAEFQRAVLAALQEAVREVEAAA